MTYRVETVTTGLGGSPFLTVHLFNDSVGTVDDAANAVVEFWEDLASVIVNECTMTVQSTVYTTSDQTGQITGAGSASTAAAVVGTSVGEPAALATQGLVQWHTATFAGGREIRGRTFIMGVPTSAISTGVPTAGYLTSVQAAADNLIAEPNTALWVWSRANQISVPVETANVWAKFAVLRSRRD